MKATQIILCPGANGGIPRQSSRTSIKVVTGGIKEFKVRIRLVDDQGASRRREPSDNPEKLRRGRSSMFFGRQMTCTLLTLTCAGCCTFNACVPALAFISLKRPAPFKTQMLAEAPGGYGSTPAT
jgi:hypothetical protein